MAQIIVFTPDLPYFPGKMGIDFFNLRFLAAKHDVTIVGPDYGYASPEGMSNLERAVSRLLVWPNPTVSVDLFVARDAVESLPWWSNRAPKMVREWLLKRLLGIHRQPSDAYERLAIQSNCAPHLLFALNTAACKAFICIQSNLAPCLEFLPGPGARFVYFHDVRSDYLARMAAFTGGAVPTRELAAAKFQEKQLCNRADGVGFVSDLDYQRAKQLFRPANVSGVGPIPIDTDYFRPASPEWRTPAEPTILFTGHLSHPPNVDAVKYFLAEIWPAVLRDRPNARFVAAGMLPSADLTQLAAETPRFYLHSNVPDIRPYFWDAQVYVVPMRFGGGVRQKILEAWAMQVPVVCTTMAAEGIAAKSGVNCWLEDTPVAFAARVAELLHSPNKSKIIVPAYTYVIEKNSVEVASGEFTRLVEKTIAEKKRRPFRLLYDLRWMKIGASGGAEQMTHELVAALSRVDHLNHYRLFCPRSTFHEWDFPKEFNVQGVFSDELERSTERLRSAAVNRLAEGLGLAPILTPPMRTLGALRKMDFDLVHSMIGYIHPDLASFPAVVTALDLQHLYYPQFFSAEELTVRDRLYRDSASRARHIICISEYTRQDMHHQYGIPLAKMTTVWLVPSRQVWQVLADGERKKLLARMGISGPFLFFPGHSWPHKNHARLIDAFALIKADLPRDLTLVLTGRPFTSDHPAQQKIHELGLASRIVHLGYRSPREMQALYQGCTVLVFPSLFEGFGMPVAEAIVAGKPVVCSNCTSLPEIAGDAALTFDGTSAAAIGESLLRVVREPELRAHLVEAGRRRRPLFSSRLSAVKTLAVYQRVYEELYD